MMTIDTRTESLLHDLARRLSADGRTVATAESCTGGLLAFLLTALPGSSSYYQGGVSSYANTAKTALLAVPAAMIERDGAVSENVAKAMAVGARQQLAADYALSLTGVAGPDGGSAEKPVGTVWCGVATPEHVTAHLLALRGSRHEIRVAAAQAALEHLHRVLTKIA